MTRYIAVVDIPVMMRVEADDEIAAEAIADAKFAEIYAALEPIVTGKNVWFGNRYDDTEVEPDDT